PGGDMINMQRLIALSLAIATTLAATTALAAPAAAQRSVLQPGATVRFHRANSSQQEQVSIVRATSDTLWFGGCDRGCIAPVSMRDLATAERYVSVRPSPGR